MFKSITQYDKQFDKLFSNISQKGFACGYFSILTAFDFLNDEPPDNINYEKNVRRGIDVTKDRKTFGGINFEQLLSLSNLNIGDINGTNVELLVNGIIGVEHMLPKDCNKFVTIFLKNEKYFVICYNNGTYNVRDCHLDMQYDFNNFDDVKEHLYDVYQFNKKIIIAGMEFPEYSSIEFIVIKNKFDTCLIRKKFNVEVNDIFDVSDDYIFSNDEIKKMRHMNEKIDISKFVKNNYEINDSDLIDFDYS